MLPNRTLARLLATLAALTAMIAGAAAPARAEGPNAVQNLPGCTANTLPANDDGSTPVDLPFTLNFFGAEYSSLFVNNNGNVTFDEALGEYTPFDFTTSGTPMIAPFLADVDTTGDGSGEVQYGETTVDGKTAFCVNWVNVGYYGSHTDKLNSFQLLLVDQGSGDFDIVMNYDKVQWETGDASGGTGGFGGTPAAVGWANGDGDEGHFVLRAGSFTSGGLLDSNTSTGLVRGSANSAQLGRYAYQVRNGAPTAPRLTGTVDDGEGNPVANAPVEICPDAGGPCRVRNTNGSGVYTASNVAAGAYDLTAYPPADSERGPGRGTVTVAGAPGDTVTADPLHLGPEPQAPPAGTTITSIYTNPNGIPVALWTDDLQLSSEGCAGATATYELRLGGQVVRNGSLTETPAGSGAYGATIPSLAPDHGSGIVTVHFDCPDTPDEDVEFGIYIDPSGNVRDEAGRPIEGAQVVLLRSASPDGPFVQVPDGSATMSPGNRANPDFTDAQGHFGWDVVAGYYIVRASKDGCVDNANRSRQYAESRVMEIPPPVTDLDLRLFCGPQGGENPPPSGGGGGRGGTGGGGGGGPIATPSLPALASLAGKVGRKGDVVLVPVHCGASAAGSCSGSVKLTARVRAKKKGRAGRATARLRTVTLGSAKFSRLKPGTTKKVRVKLGRTAKALLRRQSLKAAVSVSVKDTAGRSASLRSSVKLKAAKRAKRRARKG
jgi:hypothetical protein